MLCLCPHKLCIIKVICLIVLRVVRMLFPFLFHKTIGKYVNLLLVNVSTQCLSSRNKMMQNPNGIILKESFLNPKHTTFAKLSKFGAVRACPDLHSGGPGQELIGAPTEGLIGEITLDVFNLL